MVYVCRSFFVFVLAIILSFSFLSETVNAAQIPPQIFTYQGRLANSASDLLGGSGTTYYFKFSIWNGSTVGSGTRLWPTAAPTSASATVRQGVFTVNIGDTANGYPDTLNLDFSSSANFYLQVEVSSNNSTFETLSPRQQITSAAFAQVAGAVVGTTTPSVFGTTTPVTNSFVTIAATSTNSIALSIAGVLDQVANLFQIQNSAGTNLFSVNATGGITAVAATTTSSFATTASSTNLFTSNLSIGSLSGFLKATAGTVATALVNLASDVTGIAAVTNGGTGWAAIQSGAIPYGNGSSAISTTTAGTAGNILALLSGVPTWTSTTTMNIGGNAATVTTIPTLSGDVTNSGNAVTIDTNKVTYAKFQQVAANRLLGNATGALANVAEIATSTLFGAPTPGYVLAFNGGQWIGVATSSINNGVSSLAIPGTTITGAVTFATSSTAYNGLTASTTITNSAGTLTFANTLAGLLGVGGGGTGL
ncbi:MAG: hypothetical protein Q8L37_06860, partial [Candidatus Gottesmanbacteria bacterium]|nr:hypothetical protein [Candidatus Gottesmanbacteria bacterium]